MDMKIKQPKIYYANLWGLRDKKYDWLLKNNINTTGWKEVKPKSEFYLFVPREERLLETYENNPKITEIFPLNSVGIVTARDSLTIKWTRDEIRNTVLNFSKLDTEVARSDYNLGKDARDWKVDLAQKDLKESGLDKNRIVPILYRPFDIRYTYYTGKSRGFHCMPRPEVMRHMIQKNLGLVTPKQFKEIPGAVVTAYIAGHKTVSAYDINYLFPLYLYPDTNKKDLFSYKKKSEKHQTNINPKIFTALTEVYKTDASPEDIFYYIYAILYSNIYRTQYVEFLKIDFPRIPFTKDYKLFSKMAEYGKKLVDLHLMKSGGARDNMSLSKTIAKFQGKGNNLVDRVQYDEEEKRVYINPNQYFENIEKEVWQYQIGGYQVCNKWMKDRKGRKLSLDDIKHYCNIAKSLQETIKIQKELDNIYPEVEKKTIEFENG